LTAYSASIKPFQRTRNGRGAWLALVSQYAGEAKWRAKLKIAEELLLNRKWKGQDNFPLERFVAQHRSAFVSMTECAEHVQHQLPHEITRVTYILDGIECHHAPLQAAMANVRLDNGPKLPLDPVAVKRSIQQSKGGANISDN
jgi:hypothetical protein